MRSSARASSRQWTRPANRPSASSARPLPTRGRNRPRIGHIREGEAGMDPDLNIIDRFMEAFGNYIDSGFGLLSGDVAFLTTVLIGIDKSEEHTSELQSLMRSSYAVFCL